MTRTSELLFVDPAACDLATIVANLRPGVAAVVLDPARPAARQIAARLRYCRDLDAVHVIAHGAPGRVVFAAGEWSAARLAEDAADLAAFQPPMRLGGLAQG